MLGFEYCRWVLILLPDVKKKKFSVIPSHYYYLEVLLVPYPTDISRIWQWFKYSSIANTAYLLNPGIVISPEVKGQS